MEKKIEVRFYRAQSGREPVRDWLLELDKSQRVKIGADIQSVEYGWPIGMPTVSHIEGDIWEVRTILENLKARVLFTIRGTEMILLQGFMKKTGKTPEKEKAVARNRLKSLLS